MKIKRHVLRRATEPVPAFCLDARDVLTPQVIQYWIQRAEERGVSKDKLARARAHMAAIEIWQQDNVRKVKVPD